MLQENVIREVLSHCLSPDLKAESPGLIYEALCRASPLQIIIKEKQHRQGLQLLTNISEFLQENKIPASLRKQILTYMDALGLLVADYERKRFEKRKHMVSGAEILQYLMEEHGLKQSDLAAEFGAQSIVSQVLSGKRRLNRRQIQSLAKRFRVSPAVFF